MMHLVLLVLGLTVLLVIVRTMVTVELRQQPSYIENEDKHHAILLLWGIGIIFLLLFIPYQAWQLAGSSRGWDGALILGSSLMGSVLISLGFYCALKGKRLKARVPTT
ncbi:hypothetical protein HF078_07575 [Bacillus sp. RO2]|uniref:hypothetical protein n=1 Tax=Bacillus sp. RO2 TaxID=2723913 RepID=UPI00145CE3BD|nr:hypothetical protein [Bacillus sp. RO2]NMH72925.1 hypothetical protein [Bacillus sp. RO2]